MEEEEDGNTTPFWIQKKPNKSISLRRCISSIFFSTGLVVFLLLVIALFFFIFVVFSLKSNSVKKSWDSLNILLVLAALLFGFLNKIINKNNHNDEFQSPPTNPTHKSKPDQWYDSTTIEEDKPQASSTNSDKLYYEYQDYHHPHKDEGKNSILRRNVSSYPDLREFSYNPWNDQRTFIDQDFHVGQVKAHRRHRSVEEIDLLIVPSQMKTVFVDTLNERSSRKLNSDLESIKSVKPPSAPMSDQEQVQPGSQQDFKRLNENAGHSKARSSRKLKKDVESIPLQHSPPENKISKRDRKRGSAPKDLLNSLYSQKKKKKPRQKSMENLDNYLVHQPQDPPTFQLPVAPPQQPSTFIGTMFSTKKQKTKKKIISVQVTPHSSSATQPPQPNSETAPLPDFQRKINMKSFEVVDENSNNGGESPLNRIPPPPPPPPPAFFKNTAWKFVVQGDYVRINSSNSSRSESSDIDDVDSDVTPTAAEGHGISTIHHPLFCPSPDVNTKANTFITSFRAKLKMEKVHSFNKRGLGLSGLGPRPGPNQK